MATKKNKKTAEVVDIDQLVLDNANANRGTLHGQELLRKSFRELGAGKSVLIDKNNRLIAGNKSKEASKAEGVKKVIIVDADADTLVAVKRKDLSLDSKKGRDMSTADNATAEQNLEWDESALQYMTEKWGMTTKDWDVETRAMGEDFKPNLNPTQQNSITTSKDVAAAEKKIEEGLEQKKKAQELADVTCPTCGFKFQIKKFDK